MKTVVHMWMVHTQHMTMRTTVANTETFMLDNAKIKSQKRENQSHKSKTNGHGP